MIFNKATHEKVCGNCIDFKSDFGKTGTNSAWASHATSFFIFAVYKCSNMKTESSTWNIVLKEETYTCSQYKKKQKTKNPTRDKQAS